MEQNNFMEVFSQIRLRHIEYDILEALKVYSDKLNELNKAVIKSLDNTVLNKKEILENFMLLMKIIEKTVFYPEVVVSEQDKVHILTPISFDSLSMDIQLSVRNPRIATNGLRYIPIDDLFLYQRNALINSGGFYQETVSKKGKLIVFSLQHPTKDLVSIIESEENFPQYLSTINQHIKVYNTADLIKSLKAIKEENISIASLEEPKLDAEKFPYKTIKIKEETGKDMVTIGNLIRKQRYVEGIHYIRVTKPSAKRGKLFLSEEGFNKIVEELKQK